MGSLAFVGVGGGASRIMFFLFDAFWEEEPYLAISTPPSHKPKRLLGSPKG